MGVGTEEQPSKGISGYAFPELPISPGATVLEIDYSIAGVRRKMLGIYDGLFPHPPEEHLKFRPVSKEKRMVNRPVLAVSVGGRTGGGVTSWSESMSLREEPILGDVYIVQSQITQIPMSATFYGIRRVAPVSEIGRREIRKHGRSVLLEQIV